MALTRENFNRLVDLHGAELLHHLRRSVPYNVAEELLQETFEAAWRRRDTFYGDNARAWLYALGRFRLLTYLRKARRWSEETEETLRMFDDEWSAHPQDDALLLARLRLALESLDPIDRLILEARFGIRPLRDLDGTLLEPTFMEIADAIRLELDCLLSPEAARKRCTRALKALSLHIQADAAAGKLQE